MRSSLVSILMIFAATVFVSAQSVTPTPTPSANRLPNVRPLTDKDDVDFSRRTSIENMPAEYRVSSKAMKRTKLTEEEKAAIKNLKKDGLKTLKLFSAPKCADKYVVDVGVPECTAEYDFLPVSYYSFFDGIYGQLYAEIRAVDGLFLTGNGRYVVGLIQELGDFDVSTLDKKSETVQKLGEFPVVKSASELDDQLEKLKQGVSYEGRTVASWRKIRTGNSYLMRVVAYGLPDQAVTSYNFDMIVALRVESMTSDGMAIILWKKVSEKTAPRLQAARKSK